MHRSKAAGSGRRTVRGAAIFATLALGLSVSSFAFMGAASAVDESNWCGGWDQATAENNWGGYNVCTTVQPDTTVPLGTAVHDDAVVTKDWDWNNYNETSATNEWNDEKHVTFELFEGGDCYGDYAADPEDVPVEWGDSDWNNWEADSANWHKWELTASSSDIVLPAGEYSYLATFHKHSNRWGTEAECEPFTVEKADPTVTTEIIPSDFVETSDTVHDIATIEDQVDGFEATGTVNFTFYKNGHCEGSGQVAGAAEVDPDTGIADGSDETLPLADGEYSYMAHYEGDSNYNSAYGVCEALNVRAGEVIPVTPVTPVTPVEHPVAAAAVVANARFTG